jgi:hypothetical protein
MLSNRTRTSLAQLLELYDTQFCIVLFTKHDLRLVVQSNALLFALNSALRDQASSVGVGAMLEEVVRTQGDLRNRVTPRYRFDERLDDLSRCLLLDGYKIEGKRVVPLDPSIPETPPIEDDLLESLANSGLDFDRAIRQKLLDSAAAFRAVPPNYNACMNDGRVALESIAREIAKTLVRPSLPQYDSTKWGSILTFLRMADFLSAEEEHGLAGVYRFLSPGSHRPVGMTEAEMSRLARAIALSMCWFLVKRKSAATQ